MSHERLTIDQIRSFAEELPQPVATHTLQEATFVVYRAKDLFDPAWASESLRKLVLEARNSYCRYGGLPLLDEYDDKSLIYLVRVSYRLSVRDVPPCKVEEWLSLRFVPGNGCPHGFEDLSEYSYRSRPIPYWIEKMLLQPKGLDFSNLASGSRLCGINAYVARKEDIVRCSALNLSEHKFTAACFAFMHKRFFEDCEARRFQCRYFIVQIPDELVEGFLTVYKGALKTQVAVTPAHETLGIDDGHNIKLVRTKFIYQFPFYFLNGRQVVEFLRDLLRDRVISGDTLQHYLGESIDAKAIVEGGRFKMGQFRCLGNLFTAEGPIVGAAITGEELRGLLGKVEDGPKLRITEIERLKKSIEQILHVVAIE